MFSVTGGVGELLVLPELLLAAEPDPEAICVMLGIIPDFLSMPARRRGLSNR
jgi:hypothetical protein